MEGIRSFSEYASFRPTEQPERHRDTGQDQVQRQLKPQNGIFSLSYYLSPLHIASVKSLDQKFCSSQIGSQMGYCRYRTGVLHRLHPVHVSLDVSGSRRKITRSI